MQTWTSSFIILIYILKEKDFSKKANGALINKLNVFINQSKNFWNLLCETMFEAYKAYEKKTSHTN